MAIFVFVKVGKDAPKAGFRVMLKYFELKKSFIFSSLYLLLTELEVRTVSCGPSFSSSIYGPSAKPAGHKKKKKNEDP